MIRRPPRSTRVRSSAASDVYKRQLLSKRRARQPAIADVIATRLEEDIVLGRRHPRERLIEQDLCEQFNTHRADVRPAFFELEKKDINQRLPILGAIVRDLTPNELTEIYAVRNSLDDVLFLEFEEGEPHVGTVRVELLAEILLNQSLARVTPTQHDVLFQARRDDIGDGRLPRAAFR